MISIDLAATSSHRGGQPGQPTGGDYQAVPLWGTICKTLARTVVDLCPYHTRRSPCVLAAAVKLARISGGAAMDAVAQVYKHYLGQFTHAYEDYLEAFGLRSALNAQLALEDDY